MPGSRSTRGVGVLGVLLDVRTSIEQAGDNSRSLFPSWLQDFQVLSTIVDYLVSHIIPKGGLIGLAMLSEVIEIGGFLMVNPSTGWFVACESHHWSVER